MKCKYSNWTTGCVTEESEFDSRQGQEASHPTSRYDKRRCPSSRGELPLCSPIYQSH